MKTIYTYIAIISVILFNTNVKAINPTLPQGIIYQLEINSSEVAKSNNNLEQIEEIEEP